MSKIITNIREILLVFLPVWVVQLPGLVVRSKPITKRTCNICNFYGYFGSNGRPPRLDALCPKCGSLERHRLLWLWLEDQEKLPEPVLHFAPEKVLAKKLKTKYLKNYTTADLYVTDVDEKLDLENINKPDNSVGTIIANHVLEHVNDTKTLKEFHRILKPGGILLCEIPIIEGWDETFEKIGVNPGKEAEVYFGQKDHVRFYGKDFRERLRKAGFTLQEITAAGENVIKYGLIRGEKLFIGIKK